MIVASPNNPRCDIFWIISHFGINPVRGGRPPSDRSSSGMSAEMVGVWVAKIGSLLIDSVLFWCKIINTGRVIVT